MAAFFAPGIYWGTVTRQAMGVTKTDKPQFVLSFTVLGAVDPKDPAGYIPADFAYERTTYRVLTDKTIQYAVEDLGKLGIQIDSWGQLDPSHPNHVSVVDSSFKFNCKHETNDGKVNEKWSIARTDGGANIKPIDDQGMRKLDAMFGKALKSSAPKPAPKSDYTPPVGVDPAKTRNANAAMQQAATEGRDDVPF